MSGYKPRQQGRKDARQGKPDKHDTMEDIRAALKGSI